jgi:S1-C subfamily serine protease
MKERSLTLYLTVALVAAATGFVTVPLARGADWWPFGKSNNNNNGSGERAQVVINQEPISRDTQVTTSFSSVIKKASPSVVSIKTEKIVESRARVHPFLREFFGIPEGNERSRPRIGLGSGVVVSKDGYILTNNHVIEGADEIIVEFKDDNEEYKAEIVGVDPATDLAVLKIEKSEIPAAVLGDSEQLEVGDIVLAIGNPFGLSQTVTMGIVSATGRETVLSPGRMIYQDFIQTDASINQGIPVEPSSMPRDGSSGSMPPSSAAPVRTSGSALLYPLIWPTTS